MQTKTRKQLLLPLTDEAATVLIDYLREGGPETPPEALINDVGQQRIQAIITTFIYRDQTPWLVKLPIPNSNLVQCDLDLKTRVKIDMEELCKQAVYALVRSRVKTAGLITHIPTSNIVSQHLPQIFLNEAAKAGTTVLPEWIVTPKRIRCHQLEQQIQGKPFGPFKVQSRLGK